jgi:hypothetical protein
VPPPPSTSDDAPPVLRLPRIRSLILGPDLTYRAHLITVIGDLGPLAFATIAMAEHDDPADVLALVRYERPEVVVL